MLIFTAFSLGRKVWGLGNGIENETTMLFAISVIVGNDAPK